MIGTKNSTNESLSEKYHEETLAIPVVVTIVVLLLLALPLVYRISVINAEGSKANDISKYSALVKLVDADIQTVDAMLRNDTAALAAINASHTPQVTLIIPEVVVVETKSKEGDPEVLKVEMEGIYWSPTNPLVGINGETYAVGDSVQGHKIIKISKTTVEFRSKNGTTVVKDMYEDLLKYKR